MEVLAKTIFVKIVGAENGNRIAIAMDGSHVEFRTLRKRWASSAGCW